MKKTKIKFEDIQAGDLLEVVSVEHGVKAVMSGIAFEKIETHGEIVWETSQGGLIAAGYSGETIYRVEPDKSYTYDDIQQGDMVRVIRRESGSDLSESRMGIADCKCFYEDGKSYWLTPGGGLLIHWLDQAEIEILGRGE